MIVSETSKWDLLARPPKEALKEIKGGRLSGMTDVNPQWRYKAMHDVYGPIGIGWKYKIERIWPEEGSEGQVFMFAHVTVQVKENGEWTDPIPGIGGSMLIEKQKSGLYQNDEAIKMAITDALSVALKMLGVAADIYMGRWDGSKYKDGPAPRSVAKETAHTIDDVRRSQAEEAAKECLACLPDESAFYTTYIEYKSKLDADTQVAMWGMMHGDDSPFPSANSVKEALKRGEALSKQAMSRASEASALT